MTPPTAHDEATTPAPARAPERGRAATFLLSGIGIIMGLAVAGAIGYFAGLHQNVANEQQLAQRPAMAETVQPEPVQPEAVRAEPVRPQPVPTEPPTPDQRPAAEHFVGMTLDGEPFALTETTGTPTLLVFWAHW